LRGIRIESISDVQLTERILEQISLNDLALGNFEQSLPVFTIKSKIRGHIADAFNLAMADWAVLGEANPTLFAHVLDLNARSTESRNDANFLECLAIAMWAVDRHEDALRFVERSRQQMLTTTKPTFSCWRYAIVPLRDFLEDLGEIERLVNGESILPRFMRVHQKQLAMTSLESR
jgi:hypothetical protein